MRQVYDLETGMVTVSDGEHEVTFAMSQYLDVQRTLAYDSAYEAASARLTAEHTIRKLLDRHAAQEETE